MAPTPVLLPGESHEYRGACWTMAHGDAESWTRLSDLKKKKKKPNRVCCFVFCFFNLLTTSKKEKKTNK